MLPQDARWRVISIHALREEGDSGSGSGSSSGYSISIHALREEGDIPKHPLFFDNYTFLSTPSARRATGRKGILMVYNEISIHALREEGDDKREENVCER